MIIMIVTFLSIYVMRVVIVCVTIVIRITIICFWFLVCLVLFRFCFVCDGEICWILLCPFCALCLLCVAVVCSATFLVEISRGVEDLRFRI